MEVCNTAVSYKALYTELEQYEKNGIAMMMDGTLKSPMQIVTAHMIRENGSYMRDYIMDPEGHLQSLIFVNIN
jgi:hypothetical protein